MIELNERIRAIYFLSGDGVDWLAAVHANAGADSFRVEYRFRYANPENPDGLFDKKDRSHWYSMKETPGPLDRVLAGMQRMFDGMLALGFVPEGGLACKLLRGSMTLDQYVEEFSRLPFVHKKPEEADQ